MTLWADLIYGKIHRFRFALWSLEQ